MRGFGVNAEAHPVGIESMLVGGASGMGVPSGMLADYQTQGTNSFGYPGPRSEQIHLQDHLDPARIGLCGGDILTLPPIQADPQIEGQRLPSSFMLPSF